MSERAWEMGEGLIPYNAPPLSLIILGSVHSKTWHQTKKPVIEPNLSNNKQPNKINYKVREERHNCHSAFYSCHEINYFHCYNDQAYTNLFIINQWLK